MSHPSDCGCEGQEYLKVFCEEAITELIEKCYEKAPQLRDYVPTPGLESCCELDEVADLYGWDVADIYEEIRGYMWLRGDCYHPSGKEKL